MTAWNQEKIRFLRDAAEQVGFYQILADKALEGLPRRAHICDAGCGLGYLATAMSPACDRITAVDLEKSALAVLQQNLIKGNICNVTPLCCDAFSLPSHLQFDGMVFCFFGQTEETLRCILKHCTGKAVIFKKCWDDKRFSLSKVPVRNVDLASFTRDLDDLGITYETDLFSLDMGQPFRTVEDAMNFFRLYDRSGKDICREEIEERLTRTDSSDFPYYLPAPGNVGRVILDVRDISKKLQKEG